MTQHVIGKTLNLLVVVFGVLVLYGVLTDVCPAHAQTQVSCPLPEGVAPPPDPAVTAQQVEDGSARPEGFHAGRQRTAEPGNRSRPVPVQSVSHQAGRGALPFRLHLPRTTDARSQGVRSREANGLVGSAPQSLDLYRDPDCAGRHASRSGQTAIDRSCHPSSRISRPQQPLVARTGRRIRWDQVRCTWRLRPCRQLLFGASWRPDLAARGIRPERNAPGRRSHRLRRPGHYRQ